jgi:MarR family transcriptional regulator for hemolysin
MAIRGNFIASYLISIGYYVYSMDQELLSKPAHLINRTARMMIRKGEPEFRALGLAVAQLPVLGALKDGRALPQKELVRLAQIEQPTMAQLLGRMERDGLIQRDPDPDDKRSSLISLTSAAREKLPQVRELLVWGNEIALKGFSKKEVSMLAKLLRRVVENLEKV